MKKLLSAVFAALLVAALAVPALAHGPHQGGRQPRSYTVCSVQSCAATGLHKHSGISYYAHYYGDGHDYHGYCSIADCTLTGYHAHGGEYCFGHAANDGHGYHHTGGGHH